LKLRTMHLFSDEALLDEVSGERRVVEVENCNVNKLDHSKLVECAYKVASKVSSVVQVIEGNRKIDTSCCDRGRCWGSRCWCWCVVDLLLPGEVGTVQSWACLIFASVEVL
jgi:hypothetical protein